jgi:hypothetical protein
MSGVCGAPATPGPRHGDPMTTSGNSMTLGASMRDADYVLINGVMFETEYLRIPDKDTVADDIVLEARNGDTEVAFTCEDIDGAVHLGEGEFRLRSGAQLRFLSTATIH